MRWAPALLAMVAAVAIPRSKAHEPFVPTPSQLYGSLFVRVQMAGLHPGNDNFVDDIPKAPPPVIMRRYRRADPRTRAALLAFLERNFTFPARVRTPPVPADRTVSAHIARLWPLLTRQPRVPPAYSSLLYVPKPYIVPGGAFQEFYYWDSYLALRVIVWVEFDHFLIKSEGACRSGSSGAGIPRHATRTHDVV